MTKGFVRSIEAFAESQGVDLVRFEKGQRLVLTFLRDPAPRAARSRVFAAWASKLFFLAFLAVSLTNLSKALTLQRLRGWPETPKHRAIRELAMAARTALEAERIDLPEVRIATSGSWPTAAGTLLRLHKRQVRFCVEDAWLFQYGSAFSCGRPGAHSRFARPAPERLLIFGDREFRSAVETDPRFHPVAEWEQGAVFLNRPSPPPAEVEFGGAGASLYLASGFAAIDELDPKGGQWSFGLSSLISLPLQPGAAYNLEIVARPLPVPGRVQTVQVALNGHPITLLPMSDREIAYQIHLPAPQVREFNQLRFGYAYAEPPMAHSERSADWRPLGVWYRRMRIARAP